MWKSQRVEEALFRWPSWRSSILGQWYRPEHELHKLAVDVVKDIARQEMLRLGFPEFPASEFMAIYWVSCVASDYNIDVPGTYDTIVMPPWLSFPFGEGTDDYDLRAGMRAYPPEICNEADIEFMAARVGLTEERILRAYLTGRQMRLFLPSSHEFYSVLKTLKGRPSKKKGRPLAHSDRLAVRCVGMKDNGSTYVEIARAMGLRITEPWESKQSDPARYLVKQGQKLWLGLKNEPVP